MASTETAEMDAVEMFLPHVLREYALLADGERGALVGPRGDVVWMCAPRWDSDGVFCSLIGGGGAYAITPSGRFVWGGYYEEGSLIWLSRWITETGIIECREALAFPGDPHRVVLLRRIIAVRGTAQVHVVLEPAAEFGGQHLRKLHRDDDGRWEGQVGDLRMRWTGCPVAAAHGESRRELSLCATLTLPQGAHHDLILELFGTALAPELPDAGRLWEDTATAWREAMPNLGASIAPRDARHSYVVLRGLTSSGGGMVAAATMSLPERAEGSRNYDYRYVWDPRPVLRRAGRRRRRSAPPARRCGPVRVRTPPRRRAQPEAGLHHQRRSGARPAIPGPARLPRWAQHRR